MVKLHDLAAGLAIGSGFTALVFLSRLNVMGVGIAASLTIAALIAHGELRRRDR